MATDLVHYSSRPDLTLDRTRHYTLERQDKPSGFWVSPPDGDNWRAWRESESWGIPAIEYVYRVALAPAANLLVLHGPDDIRGLARQFPRIDPPRYAEDFPNWAAIVAQYDGVLIPAYQWSCRHDVRWYYGWDCASGCIWNLDAIESITLSHVLHGTECMHDPEIARDAELEHDPVLDAMDREAEADDAQREAWDA